MIEEWRPIPGKPGYEASSFGRIKSLGRWRHHNRHKGVMMWWKEKILKPGRQGSGHLFVVLPGQRAQRVHRLIAWTFLGAPPFSGALVRHKDNDPANNIPDNLAWGTQRDNMQDAIRAGVRLGGYRPKGSTRQPNGLFL